MFSSKTLDQRNNDPKPWWPEGAEYDEERFATGDPDEPKYAYWTPRDEYQHGILPENPILMAFRRAVRFGHAQAFMDGFLSDPVSEDAPATAHARRVLHLLSVLAD